MYESTSVSFADYNGAVGLVTNDDWYVIGPREPSGRREVISIGPVGKPRRKVLGFYQPEDKISLGMPVNLLDADGKSLTLPPIVKIVTR